jgi:adenine-specific DNA-methyltransferase
MDASIRLASSRGLPPMSRSCFCGSRTGAKFHWRFGAIWIPPLAAVPARRRKCRSRDPWYVVPDVTVPDGFLSYMSGDGPKLVGNSAGCVGTNSVHVLHLTSGMSMQRLMKLWAEPLTALSCEIEGHPLGGGMLKVEPREAARVVLSDTAIRTETDRQVVHEAVAVMKRWRHYG